MRTENNTNNFTVEALVAKYRNYVEKHCPKFSSEFGEFPQPPYGNTGEQMLISLYKAIEGANADKKIEEALSEYASSFYKEALTEDEFAYLCEHYTDAVSYLFAHRDEWNAMGKELRHGISKERMRLVHKYVKPQKGARIFIADTEYCDLAVQFPNCIVEGFTGWNYKHKEVWALGQIRMSAFGIKSEIVSGEEDNDTYTYTLPEKGSVDVVVFRVNENKYINQKIFGTECTNIEALYDLLKPGGQMLFFSEIESEMAETGEETEFTSFRKRIVNDKAISSIVSYEDHSIFGDKSSYIMLDLTKSPNHIVSIKDDVKSYEKIVPVDLIDSNILWPGFYLAKRPSEGKPLSSIVELASNERLAKFIRGKGYVLPEEAKDTHIVLPSNLSESYRNANLCEKQVCYAVDYASESENWVLARVAKQPCILLISNSEKLKIGYTTQVDEKGFAYIAGCCLIPKEGIDTRYVAALLLSPSVSGQILTICAGSVNSSILSLVLDKIIVPDHDEKERLAFLSEANYQALISSKQELRQQHEQFRKSVRMRKHALTQSLSSIEAMFYALNKHRIRQNGNLSDNEIISRVKGTTVREAFEFLDRNIEEMMPLMEHMADVEYSFGKPEWIDPEKFIEEYVAQHENGWLNFKPVISWETGHNQAVEDIKDSTSGEIILHKGDSINQFLFPKDALERVFKNIISNAQSHGYTDKSRKDYQLKISWHINGMPLIIEIENNGTPIPSDRDTASLLEYGVSTALHHDGHNGIGCNEIDDIMQRYDGKVEIISSPENQFPVKYVLTFNRSNTFRLFKM